MRLAVALGGIALGGIALLAASGCSLGIDPLPLAANDGHGALAIVGPREGMLYNEADDEDPEISGIQVTLRVDVADEAIARVDLDIGQAFASDALSDVVTEDLEGRRAAFFALSLDGSDVPVEARANIEGALPIAVQAVLRSFTAVPAL